MNNKGNNNIPSSKNDDKLLALATEAVFNDIRAKYLFKIPSTWNLEMGSKKIRYSDIKENGIKAGISPNIIERYFGNNSSIDTDAPILYLTINNDGNVVKKPIFIGEMKKQGTNDQRILEGKKKQAVGNAGPDRVWKNHIITQDFCYFINNDICPYNVFLHGCDFAENEVTTTTLSKLTPLFGTLNNFNPFFNKDLPSRVTGGSCYLQGENFTFKQLYDKVFQCCETCLEYYIKNFA